MARRIDGIESFSGKTSIMRVIAKLNKDLTNSKKHSLGFKKLPVYKLSEVLRLESFLVRRISFELEISGRLGATKVFEKLINKIFIRIDSLLIEYIRTVETDLITYFEINQDFIIIFAPIIGPVLARKRVAVVFGLPKAEKSKIPSGTILYFKTIIKEVLSVT